MKTIILLLPDWDQIYTFVRRCQAVLPWLWQPCKKTIFAY